jgi:hypothetical protein
VRGQGGLPIEVDLSPDNETVRVSNEFDHMIDEEITRQIGPYQFELDATLTDVAASTREDGLVVRHQAGYALPVNESTLPSYFYMTHMARNGTYVGVATIYDQFDVALAYSCSLLAGEQDATATPKCEALARTVAEWLPMIFAASMATYPIQ